MILYSVRSAFYADWATIAAEVENPEQMSTPEKAVLVNNGPTGRSILYSVVPRSFSDLE